MLTSTHIAASYLVSQAPALAGQPLASSEVLAVIVAGNIIDLDYVVGRIFGKKGDVHHTFITHTPAFALIVWLICFILFAGLFSQLTWILMLVAALLHLILDDIGYWFCKLGWQEISKYSQINWLYPLIKFSDREYQGTNEVLIKDYLTKARINILLEALILCLALWVFLVR